MTEQRAPQPDQMPTPEPQSAIPTPNTEGAPVLNKPAKSFWAEGDYREIARALNQSIGEQFWDLGYTDYDLDVQRAAQALGLDDIIKSDPEYIKIIQQTDHPGHFMAHLRAREIMIARLLPLVSTFPKVRPSNDGQGYEVVEGPGESYGMAPKKMRNLVGLVIVATKGFGYKAATLRGPDRVSVDQTIATLEKEYYRDFPSQCDTLRGEELTALVTTTFRDDKEENERLYKEIQERANQKK